MTGEAFYEKFKDVLHYLECPWADKEDVTVELDGNKLTFTYCDKSASIVFISPQDLK